ncbi:sensor histidine kinase [Streptomyces sp. MST-110588]|uniref:sensor histidine kinase n=1 Tax=Streptomyces sp. MST-110588 TaxID=2833628 RepID=UPI001F5D670F|nr:sensor histidine kinase [Streptomyces sp. MST-110588]UNO41473.1 sensor domain-containing protein [Streptomyces sp. MST-110588]
MHDFSAQIERSWRDTWYLLVSVAVAWFSFLMACAVPLALFFVAIVIGAPAWPDLVKLQRRLAGYERVRAGTRLRSPIPEQYLPLDGTPADRLRLSLTDPGTWRDARWLPVQIVCAVAFCVLAVAVWVAGVAVDGLHMGVGGALARRREDRYGTPAKPPNSLVLRRLGSLADAQARCSAALLRHTPSAWLEERIAELSESRAGAVEAHSAELRRIERDLHDGVQAQLVALSMRIGLAKQQVRTDPDAALQRLDEAQQGVEGALAHLRHVVRTVHPPVLTDRGLAGAVRALAASSEIPVEMSLGSVEHSFRLPASVEAAAYFVVAEALTNIRKHSGATQASVRFTRGNGMLTVTVTDNGRGGADEHEGSGLVGIRRRVAALDGTAGLSSPPGGPTKLKVELPCGS